MKTKITLFLVFTIVNQLLTFGQIEVTTLIDSLFVEYEDHHTGRSITHS